MLTADIVLGLIEAAIKLAPELISDYAAAKALIVPFWSAMTGGGTPTDAQRVDIETRVDGLELAFLKPLDPE